MLRSKLSGAGDTRREVAIAAAEAELLALLEMASERAGCCLLFVKKELLVDEAVCWVRDLIRAPFVTPTPLSPASDE
jgi:hypothetical protein